MKSYIVHEKGLEIKINIELAITVFLCDVAVCINPTIVVFICFFFH